MAWGEDGDEDGDEDGEMDFPRKSWYIGFPGDNRRFLRLLTNMDLMDIKVVVGSRELSAIDQLSSCIWVRMSTENLHAVRIIYSRISMTIIIHSIRIPPLVSSESVNSKLCAFQDSHDRNR